MTHGFSNISPFTYIILYVHKLCITWLRYVLGKGLIFFSTTLLVEVNQRNDVCTLGGGCVGPTIQDSNFRLFEQLIVLDVGQVLT